jgi:hypothetical protein
LLPKLRGRTRQPRRKNGGRYICCSVYARAKSQAPPLEQVVREISAKAQVRGLTEEKLDEHAV